MSGDTKSTKDNWDKLSSLSAVLATVVLGGLGFYYTHVVEARHQREEHAQDLQLEQSKAQFSVETQHWNEAETTHEQEWKEQQGRLTAQDLRTDELFKKTQDQNSQLQMFTQILTYLADKDDGTKQAYLKALQPLVGRDLSVAAQMMMVHAKQEGNSAIAAADVATTPAAKQVAVDSLSGALSLGNSLAANTSTFPTGVNLASTGIGGTASSYPDWSALLKRESSSGLGSVILPPIQSANPDMVLPSISQTYSVGQSYSPFPTRSGLPENIILPQSIGSSPSSLGDPVTSQSLTFPGVGASASFNPLSSQTFPLAELDQEVKLSMKLRDSIVRIVSGAGKDFREGSGFFIDRDGLIITVSSTLPRSGQSITVICNDNSSMTAQVVWRDDTPEGLALIRVERISTPISSDALSLPPQSVFIVGRTLKMGALATRGSVTAWGSSDFDVFGLTLFGFQGSPVVDGDGGLVGVLLNDSDTTATSKCKRLRLEDALKHSKP